jgi:hypothetical protein
MFLCSLTKALYGPPIPSIMTAPSDTHRRAANRGREAVALWRIKSGVWAARLFAVIFAALSIFPLLQKGAPNWVGTFILVLVAIWILVASELLRRGSRVAAVLLLLAYLAAKLTTWLVAGEPVYSGLFWNIVIVGALANGVWGAFELKAVQREAALIPPAPPRESRRPAV